MSNEAERLTGTEAAERDARLVRHVRAAQSHGRNADPYTMELIALYRPLIDATLRPYRVQEHDGAADLMADLEMAATAGVLKAIRKFDPASGKPLAGLAKKHVLSAVIEAFVHIQHPTWTRSVRRAYKRVHEANRALTTKLERTPSVSEVAERSGVSVLIVREIIGERETAASAAHQIATSSHDVTSPVLRDLSATGLSKSALEKHALLCVFKNSEAGSLESWEAIIEALRDPLAPPFDWPSYLRSVEVVAEAIGIRAPTEWREVVELFSTPPPTLSVAAMARAHSRWVPKMKLALEGFEGGEMDPTEVRYGDVVESDYGEL